MNLRQRLGWTAHVFKACTQQHHKEMLPLFEQLIPVDGVVLDVGAHAGQYAKLFAKIAPLGRVYAYEPNPYALSILRKAIGVSGLRNVEIVPCGFGVEPGVLELQVPIKRNGEVGFGLAHLGADDTGRVCESHSVPLTTIDVACRDFDRLDLIKIDVEGWELAALQGGVETLRRLAPPIFAEIHEGHLKRAGHTPQEVWAFMGWLGYRATKDGLDAPAYCGAGDYLWRAR